MEKRSGIFFAVSAATGCINLNLPTRARNVCRTSDVLSKIGQDGPPTGAQVRALFADIKESSGGVIFQRGSSPPSFVERRPGFRLLRAPDQFPTFQTLATNRMTG